MPSQVKSCLDKLQVQSMMAEGGLQKATIAIKLLATKAAEGGVGEEVANSSGGVAILIQTALLHPEIALRLGAMNVLTECVKEANSSFLSGV